MPRIYTSASEPMDFCNDHFPKTEDAAYEEFGPTMCGLGPDDRGDCFSYDSDNHPPYDLDDYKCCKCGKRLTEEDCFTPTDL